MVSKRVCPLCKEKKSAKDFSRGSHKLGTYTYCRACAHVRYLRYKDNHKDSFFRRKYGITLEQFKKAEKEQDYRCRICGEVAKLVVDHDHETKKYRGLLCNPCNKGLGHFRDDENVLKAALFYLEHSHVL